MSRSSLDGPRELSATTSTGCLPVSVKLVDRETWMKEITVNNDSISAEWLKKEIL